MKTVKIGYTKHDEGSAFNFSIDPREAKSLGIQGKTGLPRSIFFTLEGKNLKVQDIGAMRGRVLAQMLTGMKSVTPKFVMIR